MLTLRPGDTIGIISPSSPITARCPNRTARAKAFLEKKGYRILEGSLTGQSDYYRSGSIKDRAAEINEMIWNKDVRCIMSTIGGMNSNSLLPYIDYQGLIEDPKIIIGYSDYTAILLGIYSQTGLTTYYGPAFVATFGEFEPYSEMSFEYFERAMKNDFPYVLNPVPFWTDEKIDWESQNRSKDKRENNLVGKNPGKSRGRLIGGNLNTMQGIFGTKYMPEIVEGDILFIEDSLKTAAEVERSFSLLECAGIYDKVAGIIYGKHELFDDQKSGRKAFEILLEVIGNRDLPIIAEFDCSHTHPMYTLPIGSYVEMDSESCSVIILGERDI